MKSRFAILLAVALASAWPLAATTGDEHQSYVSYDAGDSVLQQGADDRAIEARVNLPVFPGDQLRTERRGRTEVRLSDGNIIAIDRDSSLRFHSILQSYEGASDQTVVEIQYGEAIVHRVEEYGAPLRLDTASASYLSEDFSVYRVRTDGNGMDDIAVFGGSVEIRTERGTERLRAGESAQVDREGRVRFSELARSGMSDFERWYLQRSDRYNGTASRHLPGRVSYADADLDYYGSWVYVHDYSSWVWRPQVSISWRPYYYGRWNHGPSGVLTWVSDEPWGWYPYHYGRWAYTPLYGWVWLPGSYYSPAWVYWTYGPSWVGWAPAGWYDCYRPYYPWLYHHYTPRIEIGVGFWGRIRLTDHDLQGWTIVDSNRIVSTRIDRAALTTDAVRERLRRDGTTGTFSNVPARFTRDEIRDPSSAVDRIARRGVGDGTGAERTGSLPDATDFFRRDPELSSGTRERIVRSIGSERTGEPGRSGTDRLGRPETSTSGVSEVDRGDRARSIQRDRDEEQAAVGRGESRTTERSPVIGRGADSDRISRAPEGNRSGTTGRDTATEAPRSPRVDRPTETSPTREAKPDEWRGAVNRDRRDETPSAKPEESGRTRTIERPNESPGGDNEATRDAGWRQAPVPKRVIDSIGGTRLAPRDESGSSGSLSSRGSITRPSSSQNSDGGSSSRGGTVSRDRSSGSDSSRSSSVKPPSNSSSGGGSISRSPSRSSGSSSTSKSSSSGSSSSSKPPSSSGKVERKRPN